MSDLFWICFNVALIVIAAYVPIASYSKYFN